MHHPCIMRRVIRVFPPGNNTPCPQALIRLYDRASGALFTNVTGNGRIALSDPVRPLFVPRDSPGCRLEPPSRDRALPT